MPSTALQLTGNQSFANGSVTYSGGAGNYTNLNTITDATSMQLMGDNAFASYPLTDMPSDLLAVTAITITLRCMRLGAKGDFATFDYAQILKSDSSTAVTSQATGTSPTTPTTLVMNPSILVTDKTSWDGAILKIKQTAGTTSGTEYYWVTISITYTISSGETQKLITFLFGGQL